jgi:ABC-2 type transport system ATP-binding protein
MRGEQQGNLVIRVEGVSKDFLLPHRRTRSVKQAFTELLNTHDTATELQHALQDISFDVRKGEFLGIVGRNGSCKSTLLKILAGIYQPSKGNVKIQGKLVPFIELGVGFNPELTGRENVYLNGALLGFSKREVNEMYDGIVAFAELERFMDQKLKNYSSGMQVRLAFSLAIRAKADILLIDEVLAVGDADFQRKCFDYFRELKKSKTTVVFVSHDMNAIIEYCDRAVLVDRSRLVDAGSPEVIAKQYNQLFIEHTEDDDATPEAGEKKRKRWGDQLVVVQKCEPDKKSYRADKDSTLTITAEVVAKQAVDHNIAIGFLVKNASGTTVLGTNTYEQRKKIEGLKTGERLTVSWQVPNVFGDGKYFIDAATTSSDGSVNHDWREEVSSFRVYREEYSPYIITPTIPVSIERKS